MAAEQQHLEQLKKQARRPSTPGDVLANLLETSGISQKALAARIGVSRATVNRVVQGHRVMTPDLANRLGRFFGNGPALWIRLQQHVDLWDALHVDQSTYERIQPMKQVA
jgi:addiction module HigA family antidote